MRKTRSAPAPRATSMSRGLRTNPSTAPGREYGRHWPDGTVDEHDTFVDGAVGEHGAVPGDGRGAQAGSMTSSAAVPNAR
ncbi:hypothetical protein EEB14_25335 [Rhodococcus sp. WS4]|nr:hypothetical protein EEB14_25335 [Rhodococcus sp. WS4]